MKAVWEWVVVLNFISASISAGVSYPGRIHFLLIGSAPWWTAAIAAGVALGYLWRTLESATA